MAEQAFPTGPIAGSEVGFTTLQIAGNEFGLGGTTDLSNCNSCDPPIPDTLYVTFAGLGGDLAAMNGKWAVNWSADAVGKGYPCWWKNYEDPVNPIQYPYVVLAWAAGHWSGGCATVLNCSKGWYKADVVGCTPEGGTYVEYDPDSCTDSGCTDGDSCEQSAGATCVVSTS